MIAHLNVTSFSHLHCQFDLDWRSDFFLCLNLWCRTRSHLTGHKPHKRMKNPNLERCVLVLKSNPLEPGTIVFLRTPAPWWSCGKSTPLLVTNPRLFAKVVTKLKILLSSHGLQFPALVTIAWLPSSHHSTHPRFPAIVNYHYNLGFYMYSQLLAELIPIINKCFNYHQTPIAIGPLSYYLFNRWITSN